MSLKESFITPSSLALSLSSPSPSLSAISLMYFVSTHMCFSFSSSHILSFCSITADLKS